MRASELKAALEFALLVMEKGMEVRMEDRWPALKPLLGPAIAQAKAALAEPSESPSEPYDAVREADAKYVLRWCYQSPTVPANIHDLAARALGEPSLAHGCAASEPAPLQVREGKWYRRRDGEVVGPAKPNRSDFRLTHPWRCGTELYSDNGKHSIDVTKESPYDLVAEVPEPQVETVDCEPQLDMSMPYERIEQVKRPLPWMPPWEVAGRNDPYELFGDFEAWLHDHFPWTEELSVYQSVDIYALCCDLAARSKNFGRSCEPQLHETTRSDSQGTPAPFPSKSPSPLPDLLLAARSSTDERVKAAGAAVEAWNRSAQQQHDAWMPMRETMNHEGDEPAPMMIEPDRAVSETERLLDTYDQFEAPQVMTETEQRIYESRRTPAEPVEVKYRPFRDAEEFKPHARRILRSKTIPHHHLLASFFNNYSAVADGLTYEILLRDCVFDDTGNPVGVSVPAQAGDK